MLIPAAIIQRCNVVNLFHNCVMDNTAHPGSNNNSARTIKVLTSEGIVVIKFTWSFYPKNDALCYLPGLSNSLQLIFAWG